MRHIKAEQTFTQGVGMGPVYRVPDKNQLTLDEYKVESEDEKEKELAKFDRAVQEVSKDLDALAEDEEIFGVHLFIAQDPSLRENVEEKIQKGENAEQATKQVMDSFRDVVKSIPDNTYMQERADDFEDVRNRLLQAMQPGEEDRFADLKEPSIIVASDLYPSDTAALDDSMILGCLMSKGGVTSHVAIMARNRDWPALIGVGPELDSVQNGDYIAFDAGTGDIYIDPDEEVKAKLQAKSDQAKEAKEKWLKESAGPVTTLDGRELEICCNIGNPAELDAALPYHPDGVGLYRTEFLFMNSDHFPTEEEQFQAYKSVAEKLDGPVTIRTMDIGGDKTLDYYEFDEEENPFLGWRGIRMALTMTDIFKTQIRAILRASAFGKVRIMFPMITSLSEINQAKDLVEECKKELADEGVDFDENIELGIMVETPAAVFIADELAQAVDFFSIGTNDLTQYVLAVDRGNDKIKDLFTYFHPAVLRSIDYVLEAGHRQGIKVGMCGEMAGNSLATQLLLGLGLDEFSMSAPMIPTIDKILRTSSYEDAVIKAGEALDLPERSDVEAFLHEEDEEE